jgi:uncharacterized protein (DUF983 family)
MSIFHYLSATFQNKCPRCRKGDLFKEKGFYHVKDNLVMYENCPVCGQATEIEVGFYYGTGYVSYAVTVAFSIATFIAWKVLIGMSFDIDDNRIFYWLGTNVFFLLLMQPPLMRLSRSLWLSWFVSYDKDWQNKSPETPERVNKEQQNNW